MEIVNTILGSSIVIGLIGIVAKYYSDIRIDHLNRKKKVYDDLAQSLRVFLNDGSDEYKRSFLACNTSVWLWGSDKVLIQLSEFLAYIQDREKDSLDQSKIKSLFRKIIIEMRKDVGFANTKIIEEQIQLVNFHY